MSSLPLLPIVDAALRGMLLAGLLLLAGVLLRDRPRLAAARAGVLMCAGLCVQVIGSTPLLEAQLPRAWQVPLVAVAVGNAVLFWVFVQALFDDEFRWRPLHAVAWGAVAVLAGVNCSLGPAAAGPVALLLAGLQRAVPLVFAVLAALAAWAHWRDDLVEGRRALRGFIAIAGTAYTLGMLAVRLGSPRGRPSELAASIDVALLLVMIAVVAWRLLRLTGTELFPSAPAHASALADPPGHGQHAPGPLSPGLPRPGLPMSGLPLPGLALPGLPLPDQPGLDLAEPDAPALPPPDLAEARLAAALQRLMADERAYRAEALTVASLAARLAVPEYRLRRLINQRLGHRNFNAYVNGFRLSEARGALANPALRELPVLSIALEAGFQSIGPFNRAFKSATGLTPSEFRKENIADS